MSKPVTWQTQAEEITADKEIASKDPEVRDKVKPEDKAAGAKAIFPEPKHEPIPTEKNRALEQDKADSRAGLKADPATDLKIEQDSEAQDREQLRHRSL